MKYANLCLLMAILELRPKKCFFLLYIQIILLPSGPSLSLWLKVMCPTLIMG